MRYAISALSTLQAKFYALASRASYAAITLIGGAIANGRHIPKNANIEAPLTARAEGDSAEFVLAVLNPSLSAARQEIYGIEADFDVSDSPR